MGRRNRPRRRSADTPPPAALSGALGRIEDDDDGTWAVRTILGSRALKTYRCPGCDHEIVPGTPHLVAWSVDDPLGGEDRRHWHTGCWRGRATRGLTRRWS